MAKKIEVSTVRQMADVQVINVTARLVCIAVKAQLVLNTLLEGATTTARKWNDDTKQWEDEVDDNGEAIMHINCVDGEVLAKEVLPFLNELVDALKDE